MTAALLALLVAGCVETPSPELRAPAGPELAAAPEQLRLDGCQGAIGAFMAPRAAVEAALPDAFRPADVGAATVLVQAEVLRCERASTATIVFPDVALFQSFVRVTPADAAWSSGQPSRYQLDALVSAPELAQALAALGLRAPTVAFHATGLPTRQVWTFEGRGASAELNFPSLGAPPVGETSPRTYLWHAEGDAYRRIDVQKSYQLEGAAKLAGSLTAEGLTISAFLPGCCAGWEGQAYAASREIWTAEPRTFVP